MPRKKATIAAKRRRTRVHRSKQKKLRRKRKITRRRRLSRGGLRNLTGTHWVDIELEGHGGGVNSANFSPDSTLVVTTGDRTVRVWHANSGEQYLSFVGHGLDDILSANFSPDGKLIVSASADGTAKIWSSHDRPDDFFYVTLGGHMGIVHSASFSPDGTKVVTASADGAARIWRVNDGKLLHIMGDAMQVGRPGGHYAPIDENEKVTSASFSPDGKMVVTVMHDQPAKIWRVDDGKLIHTLEDDDDEPADQVLSAHFSPLPLLRVVTASRDGTATIWDIESGESLLNLHGISQGSFDGHTEPMNTAYFSPDGKKVVTASDDDTAKIWSAETGQLLKTLQGHTDRVVTATFSPDGRKIVTASSDKTAKVWNPNTGQSQILEGQDHAASAAVGEVVSASFSPDSRKVVTASYDYIGARIWSQVPTGIPLGSIQYLGE